MLTREVCNNLWPEIEAELGALFEKYGVAGRVTKCVLTREGAQESAGRFATFTLQVSEVQEDGEVLTPERIAFARYAPMHGISLDWLDREFAINGEAVRLTGYNTAATAYPFICTIVGSDRAYKLDAAMLERYAG